MLGNSATFVSVQIWKLGVGFGAGQYLVADAKSD